VAIWNILWVFDTFFPHFGMLNQEKSGNPVIKTNFDGKANNGMKKVKHKKARSSL
jgi:hypothetical protein